MSDNRKISHFKVLDHSTMSKCSDLSFGESHNSTLEHVTGSYDCLRNTIASYIDDATIKPMLGGRIIPSTVRKITACCGATVVGDQKEDVFCELGIYDLSNTNVGGGLRDRKSSQAPNLRICLTVLMKPVPALNLRMYLTVLMKAQLSDQVHSDTVQAQVKI
jgi:hypothetical protein